MPVILRFKGYRFFFYSNEGAPLEPAHIHIRGTDGEAKFWLTPEVLLARNDGFNARDLKELVGVVEENRKLLMEAWNDYFA
ncbi:DUF4160 domain-containing protein [Citrobacter rodentium]|jgi:hypothetical protein|uniref:DUF4160 domain-containing protein n=2 Tax=Citrobacter rodentium TaxID=67825 RepID=D2THR4_CITRI|nr:DUF4160 domain-containing protein [Citrobacter rodentium]KIQ49558.1 hypothetical protein TA05_20445 [Citrobacter rodentium]QBY29223.1 DUF4160 domain-containing protein [Citrobacter rodentium]UHO28923.1 DUF4160 domain-containing protein [Citrobacter rodentium NBRC 105723 = DSM 16636]CBG89496.1 conserved hypothetical protein [Citrobacter rodentium ICC168]HAT8012036.1 hypothetical protein [Citrobacter rodentium NBRC 105723 = DSM 16636]